MNIIIIRNKMNWIIDIILNEDKKHQSNEFKLNQSITNETKAMN